jgi:preprotein translocase subunit SecE
VFFLKEKNMKKIARKIVLFFANVKKEMKKVRWLTKKEMVKYSLATLSLMVFFALFFSLSDVVIGIVRVWL